MKRNDKIRHNLVAQAFGNKRPKPSEKWEKATAKKRNRPINLFACVRHWIFLPFSAQWQYCTGCNNDDNDKNSGGVRKGWWQKCELC